MSSPFPLVYAVTLNWKRPADTIACLKSLADQTYPNLQTLVVDNGSGDDSVARIQAACPNTHLIVNSENCGFARGTNIGILQALALETSFVFILNNDTFLAPDAVERLVQHYEKDVGLLAPIIYYADEPRRVWSLGGGINRWLLETKRAVRGQEDTGQWPVMLEQDFVPACGLLIPRLVFERVGYFDERFFMYYEDLDFSLRVRQTGLRILSVTEAKMWHRVSSSSGGSDSLNERYWMARSSVLYFRKHAQPWQWLLIGFWRLGSAMRTSWRLRQHEKREALRAYWRGLWHGIWERPL